MSGTVVNVLAPTGHRKNVKVQPNTALLKVLEEVCNKFKYDPNEYDLKHHKRILDLTTSFRFSGLPNNAQLEMVEALKKRQDVEVEIVVQLGDGSRLDGKYKPNTTLFSIIQQLCPNELTGSDLFAIYMRTEVGHDKLGETSLKDLGLISGRAIVRLVHRDPNAAKIQANVALNLHPKPIEKEEDEDPEDKIRRTNESTTGTASTSNVASTSNISQSIVKMLKEEKNKEEPSMAFSGEGHRLNEELPVVEKSNKVERMDISSPEPSGVPAEEDEDMGEIHILGERNAVLFTLDAAEAANLSDLPDSFFDLNVNDLKLIIRELRTQAEGTVEQPLMTAKLREMEDEQKQLLMLNQYKTVIIRVQFPNRYVLQGTFTPYETIETVTEFVRSYLAEPNADFYLYTTPPKNVLSKESHLFEANCVPSAILHFGSEQKQLNYLKEDILEKISSPKASLMQALTDRGIKKSDVSTESNDNQPSTSSSSSLSARKTNDTNFKVSPAPGTGDAKMPKWFKPFAK